MTLDEDDYLTYQLYTASKTPRVRKARIWGWIFTTITFISLAYILFDGDNETLSLYFVILAVLSLIFYPFYSRWRYKRHYRKYIQDTYKNRFGLECNLEINDEALILRDKTGETKINTDEIEQVNEIKDFYFLKIRTGGSVIISKSKSENIEKIELEVISLIRKKGIEHNIELNWKWK